MSQFVHGLCFSNIGANSVALKMVMYESIVLADRFIQAIHQTFRDEDMTNYFLRSETIQELLNSKDFNLDDLAEFTHALVRKDKTLLI